ncbi:MAG: protein-glutamate O-methyltransferase [Alphaproteobacteria bacterium]|nr:protein-glutamate O-methyltransferase [Alphaproteobacteria bacterium]MBV8549010.1 protein-glutamate O-methyltransferase [Alphaproteobacteria bacterium]
MDREFIFTDRDFQHVASLIHEQAGIHLPLQKKDMVYARLSRRLRKLGLQKFRDYVAFLRDHPQEELEELINAITTNVTHFFRENHHFDHLANTMVPHLLKNTESKRVRLWSAGSSQGMEAYSIAMTLHSHLPKTGWDIKILATDIDTNVLDIGRAAVYEKTQLDNVPRSYTTYFEDGPEGDTIRVSQEIRRLVHFKTLNLLEHWPMKGQFDAIFCRNVVIYFDKPTQAKLFARYADILKPQGWLYIGHSENLSSISDRFETVGRTIYRKAS